MKQKGKKTKNTKVEFRYKETPLEVYGKAVKRLGGKPALVEIMGEDQILRKCVVRGKFFKRMWINADDIVLVEVDKLEPIGEIIYKYTPSDTKRLFKEGIIKEEWVMKEETEVKSNVKFDDDVELEDSESEISEAESVDSLKKAMERAANGEDSEDIDNI